MGGLAVHDGAQVQRAGAQHYAHQRRPEGKLVADDLGAGAQGSEQRIFVIGRPARKCDSIDPTEVTPRMTSRPMFTLAISNMSTPCQVMWAPKGTHGNRDQGAAERDHGGQDVERPVYVGGHAGLL